MAQSQYAEAADMQLVGITPAASARFGAAAVVAQLQAASSVADSYLVSQFTLPLTDWDMSLTAAVCDIAAYKLYCQYGFNPANSPADQLIVTKWENALAWLAQIRDEKVFPQFTDSGDTVGASDGPAYIVSDDPVGFTSRGIIDSGDCE